jgi:uncharacterized membrane protein YbhN (UPF0104 family)
MSQNRVVRFFAIAMAFFIVMLIVLAGFGQAVHYLWNWLMPEIFGVKPISYWQALGLLGLSWILFGGFGWLGGRRRGYGPRMGRMGGGMTEEQRARMREAMFRRFCGDQPVSPGQPST